MSCGVNRSSSFFELQEDFQAALPLTATYDTLCAALEAMLVSLPEEFPQPVGSDFLCFRSGGPERHLNSITQDYVLATSYKASDYVQSVMLLRHRLETRSWMANGLFEHFHLTGYETTHDIHRSLDKPGRGLAHLHNYLSIFYESFFTLRPMACRGRRADLAYAVQDITGESIKPLMSLMPVQKGWRGALFDRWMSGT